MLTLPDKQKIASFDIDAQCTFTALCPDELPVIEGDTIVDELNAQAQFATYRIGSKDAHSPKALWVADEQHPPLSEIKGDNVDLRWPLHAVPGTQGFELIPGLPKVTEYDFFVWKGIELDMHPYGNCYHDFAEKMSTGLVEFLRARDVTTVLAGGLATDYCVKNTVMQLVNAGFDVIVNLAACRGIADDTVATALEEMREAGVVFVDSASELKC